MIGARIQEHEALVARYRAAIAEIDTRRQHGRVLAGSDLPRIAPTTVTQSKEPPEPPDRYLRRIADRVLGGY